MKAKIHVSCLSTGETPHTKQGRWNHDDHPHQCRPTTCRQRQSGNAALGDGSRSIRVYHRIWFIRKPSVDMQLWRECLLGHSSRIYWQSQSEKHPVESWNEETCRKIVNAAIGIEIPYDVISYRPWIISRKVAKQYRMDQVFLLVILIAYKNIKRTNQVPTVPAMLLTPFLQLEDLDSILALAMSTTWHINWQQCIMDGEGTACWTAMSTTDDKLPWSIPNRAWRTESRYLVC